MKLDFCCICGTKENLHHHHIIPRFRGGSDDENNLITLCGTHHAWIHGLRPTSWNNHGNAVKKALQEAKDLGFQVGRKPKFFTKEEIDNILEMREQGVGIKKCAAKFKCGVGTIYNVINDPEHYYKLSGVTQSDKTYKEYKEELKIAEREQQKKLNAAKKHLEKEKQIKEELTQKSIERLDNRTNELESWFEERKNTLLTQANNKIESYIEEEKERVSQKLDKKIKKISHLVV